jgi:SAM-dependent methyltransferase
MNSTLATRLCPICGADHKQATLFLESSWDPKKASSFTYASRKDPEYMSFRLLTCQQCDVVYAAEAPKNEAILEAYQEADYDSSEEAILAAKSYAGALAQELNQLKHKELLLEIGAGTGVFLEALEPWGFKKRIGFEPSEAALKAAKEQTRSLLVHGIFKASDFPSGSASVIACFMTMEHVEGPRALVEESLSTLAAGGMIAIVVHDRKAWVNRLLGRKSPIIDVEHLQIFSKKSIRKLLEDVGFVGVKVRAFKNSYPLSYWNRLFPFPKPIKQFTGSILKWTGIGKIRFGINVGNLMVTGYKKS